MKHDGFQINQYYRLTWQLLLLTTCILGVASQVARPMVLAGYFLVATLIVSRPAHRWHKYRRALGLSIGGSLLILVSQQALTITNTEGFISILIEIISGSLPWLLITHDRYRSYWLAILNTTVIAIGSMTAGTTSLIYLGFLVFITLILLNLNAANLYFSALEAKNRRETLPRGYFRQFIYVIPVGLLAGVVIFLFFPRVQSFSWSISRGRGDNYTGYTGLVNLTADGELLLSHALNLMVESRDEDWLKAASSSLLLRGDSLDSFDGTRWRSTFVDFRPANKNTEIELNSDQLADVKSITIHLEPSNLNNIFYTGKLLSIRSIDTPNVHFLSSSSSGQVIRDPQTADRLSYEIQFVPQSDLSDTSAAPDQAEQGHSKSTLSEEDLAKNLEVPPTIREAKYFKDWLRELSGAEGPKQLQAIATRLDYLFHRDFRSTLANRFSGTNALEAFLSIDKQGHCEYFATTAALSLRALGFPARLVVGYRGGLYNTMLGTLDVRDEDAHAWVEVFEPNTGWLPFDPTPATIDPSSPYKVRWQILVNSLNFWLHRYIIDYDQATQRELWQEIRSFGQRTPDLMPELGPVSMRYLVATGIMGGFLIIIFLVRVRGHRNADVVLPGYYRMFSRKLNKIGLSRRRGESFGAFHQRVAKEVDNNLQITTIDLALHTDLYAASHNDLSTRTKLARETRRWRPRRRPGD